MSNSEPPPDDAFAAAPTSSVSVTVSSVWVASPASGSALVASLPALLSASLVSTAVPPPEPPSPLFASALPPDLAAALFEAGLLSPLTEASSSWATSRTSTSSRASPLACWEVSPSESITRQNGQPTAIWSAPVATASAVRVSLMREPIVSSIHMRAPPAPQQKDRSELRGISTSLVSGMTLSSSRGAS